MRHFLASHIADTYCTVLHTVFVSQVCHSFQCTSKCWAFLLVTEMVLVMLFFLLTINFLGIVCWDILKNEKKYIKLDNDTQHELVRNSSWEAVRILGLNIKTCPAYLSILRGKCIKFSTFFLNLCNM